MDRLSYFAKKQIPFLFIISYDKKQVFVEPINKLKEIFFKTPLLRNYQPPYKLYPSIIQKDPIDFAHYQEAFMKVQEEIQKGNTYLLNLTFPTPIKTTHSLIEIFYSTKAKFKLYFLDQFICFSPERFVKIDHDGTITTYPMKGTIDASIPNAKEQILKDPKEMAEHTMIVDLLRNDLAMVANRVRVDRFRYVDKIRAGDKELLQVSSQISAKLPPNWKANLDKIFDMILPAGSITGAPKRSTCHIIEKVERYDRGFYTGVFGIFDGYRLDSAVMIRFIEKNGNSLIYKSGGGITIESKADKEYQELTDKIYLPT